MSVLLYSGGLDSYLYSYLLRPTYLLYFDSGSVYSPKEITQFSKLPLYGKLIIDKSFNFKEVENNMVHNRNLFFALKALEYSQKVYLGVNLNDYAYDKTKPFIDSFNELITVMYAEQNPLGIDFERDWGLYAPFIDKSKSQLIQLALAEGLPIDTIKRIRTCYSETSDIGCGKCLPCMHKGVALNTLGHYHRNLFDEDLYIFVDKIVAEKYVENTPLNFWFAEQLYFLEKNKPRK